MDPPQFLVDALKESVTSGTFVDTKFYVFSRREVSGRVGSPRSLYCNGKVLSTVPYFSTLFSDGFSEGQTRNINEGFPNDSPEYTDYYDYLSDSDLEDEEPPATVDDDMGLPRNAENLDLEPSTTSEIQPQSSQDPKEVEVEKPHARGNGSVRMGKVAIIRDMAAVTFEAMIYFLYTGEVKYAPFSSDPHQELPPESRAGNWSIARPPSPSARSIYRLADKYDIPTLKEHAKAHICENLEHCNIVDEVFSSFSFSFPEILSVQIARLVSKIKTESPGGAEGATRRQLREKIAALSQLQLARASDALAMIWSRMKMPQPLSAPRPMPIASTESAQVSHWHRVMVALLKSISTGVFIDVQFYAYNAIKIGLPLDLKPLFTSSIVIEVLAPAITTQTGDIDSQVMCPPDGLTDDYERWDGELSATLYKGKAVLRHQTEAAGSAEGREVVVLTSGAWKTWMLLLSWAYTREMIFAPLRNPASDNDAMGDTEIQWHKSTSSHSMYSLAASLGAKNVMENALKYIRSKLTTSNVMRELFSSFSASHEAVRNMEIEFLHESLAGGPELLIEHIQKMASGEAPFFPATLSLVYDKLAEITSKSTDSIDDDFNWFVPKRKEKPASTWRSPTPTPGPSDDSDQLVWLKCTRCSEYSRMRDLYDGIRCPVCPAGGRKRRRPIMKCDSCGIPRSRSESRCIVKKCQVKFA